MASTAPRSRILGSVSICLILSANFVAQVPSSERDLTAHEWGTFTSVAGNDGRSMTWSTLNGPDDLPAFVGHISGVNFKAGLRGTLRMETPVLYFYSPEPTDVSVKVELSKGLITEWYPHASHVTPDGQDFLGRESLTRRHANGSISWDSVRVSPGAEPRFPLDQNLPDDQYYAARETASAPLLLRTVAGDQEEKFLFYRGVSGVPAPISASTTSGGQVRLANLAEDEIPNVILFERYGEKLGYRLGGALSGEMSLDAPELTSTVESLSRDIEDVLTAQGLYPDEARAMIATWRGSWFEEGSRLFYIVPQSFLSTNLPLTITPAPGKTVRVFVGRVELVTPATEQAVRQILVTHDVTALQKYSRFLEPILAKMKADDPEYAKQISEDLDKTYSLPALQNQK
jgi:hypothetical protein